VNTADGFAAWQDFSITSNYAFEIPCYLISGYGFPSGQCHTSIRGTSMATPRASAVLAVIASARPDLQGSPAGLVQVLKDTARGVHRNTTPVLSATDRSGGDATGSSCTTGYCHLAGPAVSDADAYGAGIVDAAAAVGA
jgi:Subtilase family